MNGIMNEEDFKTYISLNTCFNEAALRVAMLLNKINPDVYKMYHVYDTDSDLEINVNEKEITVTTYDYDDDSDIRSYYEITFEVKYIYMTDFEILSSLGTYEKI